MKKLQIGLLIAVVSALLGSLMAHIIIHLSLSNIIAASTNNYGSPNSIQGKANIVKKLNTLKADEKIYRLIFKTNNREIFHHQADYNSLSFLQRQHNYILPGADDSSIHAIVSLPPKDIVAILSLVFCFNFLGYYLWRRKTILQREFDRITYRFAHDIRIPLRQLRDSSFSPRHEQLIQDIEHMSENLLASRKLEKKEHYQPLHELAEILGVSVAGPSFSFYGSRNDFRRFLYNVRTNACEAKTTEAKFQVSIQLHAKEVVLCIEDDGPGFNGEILARLGIEPITSKSLGNGIGILESTRALRNDKIQVKFYNKTAAVIELTFSQYLLHQTSSRTIILIEDDPYVAHNWKEEAKLLGFIFFHFNAFSDFETQMSQLDRSAVIFCDSKLNEGAGEELLQKAYKHGFANLYLATSLFTQDLGRYPWLKGVFDKKFPKEFFRSNS